VLIANFKSKGIADIKTSINGPPFTTQTAPFTNICQTKRALILAQNKFLLYLLIAGVTKNITIIVAKINVLTGSKNKFVNATIDTGRRYWIDRLSVSFGMKIANAIKGVKFGMPTNLLMHINIMNREKFFNI
jgi:hypothetical protein